MPEIVKIIPGINISTIHLTPFLLIKLWHLIQFQYFFKLPKQNEGFETLLFDFDSVK